MYLIIAAVEILSAALFCYDKRAAVKHRRRVPEAVLHLMELVGGVFVVVPLMYIIRHKNRKFAYFWLTYLIFACWTGGLYWFFFVR